MTTNADAVPAGWKLVPVEPTDDMEAAAEDDYEQTGATFPQWKSAYRAMLAEAPSAIDKLFEVLMQQNIVTSEESYLALKCVGVPPTEEEFVRAVQQCIATSPAAPSVAQDERGADTGNPEADRIIGRLSSSDPDFDDCIDAVAFIRKLIAEHKGPDGFATWKDTAIHERQARAGLERDLRNVSKELVAAISGEKEDAASTPANAAAPAQSGEPVGYRSTHPKFWNTAQPAQTVQSGEPIYQIEQSPGRWTDVDRETYFVWLSDRRIVHTAPQTASGGDQ